MCVKEQRVIVLVNVRANDIFKFIDVTANDKITKTLRQTPTHLNLLKLNGMSVKTITIQIVSYLLGSNYKTNTARI